MPFRLLTARATICTSLRLFLCVLVAATAAAGQTTLGTIFGRVTDASNATVPHASVTLRNEATNVVTSGVTTDTGDYVFANINPGTYELTLHAPGLAGQTISHVVLEVSQTVRRDVTMTVNTVTSSVQVTADHVLVQTDTTSVGGVIETKQVDQMPLNGRTNMFGLLALAPGVQNASANPRISGSSWIGTNSTMDGMVDMEMENARLSGADPSLDSVQEFRVIDSTGSAEYGAGAAQVIISTKSGSNQFHGSLFAYNRNRDLAAKNFFATGLPKAPYNRNEFGGSLGGPIKRNRLFFFGSYEGLLYHSSSTNQTAQPTAALLQGNFSGLPPIIDPYTGSPFPNNQIPSNRISSIATNLFPYFPAPNRATTATAGLGTNYIVNVPLLQHNYRYQGRVDYSINPNNSLFVRYFYVDEYNQTAGATDRFGSDYQPLHNQNVAANYTRIISPTLVNVATFGWMRLTDQFLSQNHTVEPSSLIPGIPATYPGLGGIPAVSITGFTGLSDSLGSGDTEPTYQASDTLTWVKGRHTIKTGISFLRYQFLSYGNQSPEYGAVSFNGQYTTNAFADFLLGYVSGSSIPLAPVAIATRNYRYGSFVQDDWRVNDHLTLNVGLRYDVPTRYENVEGGMANWYPQLDSLVVIKGNYDASTYPSLPIVRGSSVGINTGNYIGNDLTQFAPRVGFAWRPFDSQRFVIRAGYGMYYDSMPWKFGSYDLGANPPFSGTLSFEPAAGSTPSLLLNNAFPTGSGSVPSGVGVTALAQNFHYPLTHQGNFTMESQVMANTIVRATYLGDEREHSGALYPVNTPLPAPGPVQPLRPFQPFGSINLFENGETSNTQQLQVSAERRFSRGLSFGVQYAWTKELDGSLYDQSLPTVPNNIRLDRGNDPMIRQQYMIANYVYQVPFGRGRKFGSSMPTMIDTILGGWETSGIITLGSGLPFSVTFDSSVQGWPNSRANIVGKPGVSQPSLSQWFNPAAFALPAPFFYGNSAPNSLFGPGFSNWDTAAMKNFAFREQLNVQFRAEFFNALNHPSFANPNSDISVPSRVGTITSTTGSPRVVQFALRLGF